MVVQLSAAAVRHVYLAAGASRRSLGRRGWRTPGVQYPGGGSAGTLSRICLNPALAGNVSQQQVTDAKVRDAAESIAERSPAVNWALHCSRLVGRWRLIRDETIRRESG